MFCRKRRKVERIVDECRIIVVVLLQYNSFIIKVVEYVEYVELVFTSKSLTKKEFSKIPNSFYNTFQLIN